MTMFPCNCECCQRHRAAEREASGWDAHAESRQGDSVPADARRLAREIVEAWVPCWCHEGFTSRKMIDPSCPRHFCDEDLIDAIAAALTQRPALARSRPDDTGLQTAPVGDVQSAAGREPRTCNRHVDCDAADERARATGRRDDHCHTDDCEDCFGA